MQQPEDDRQLPNPSDEQRDPYHPYGLDPQEPYPPAQQSRRIVLPVVLFLATCASTYVVGGLAFASCIMLILTTHELGHFFQAVRYRVPASLPFFIPMPLTPIGTMGAVIAMHAHVGDRKAIFDIGISGPIAGLVPAIACCLIGLSLSEVREAQPGAGHLSLGEPLLFKGLSYVVIGPVEEGKDVFLHPVAFAGWVGLFITGLNMIPIGQLDGGHVLYCLLLKKAHPVASGLLLLALAAVVISGNYGWSLMLALLFFMGPRHPPTADDTVPLGTGRLVLGWLSLAFVPIGFTPTPFIM